MISKQKFGFLAIAVALLSALIIYFYPFKSKFANSVYPKGIQYTLLRPVSSNSEMDDNEIVYYFCEMCKYDSLDLVILKELLNKRNAKFIITKDDDILVLSSDITIESLSFIEGERLFLKKQILSRSQE